MESSLETDGMGWDGMKMGIDLAQNIALDWTCEFFFFDFASFRLLCVISKFCAVRLHFFRLHP